MWLFRLRVILLSFGGPSCQEYIRYLMIEQFVLSALAAQWRYSAQREVGSSTWRELTEARKVDPNELWVCAIYGPPPRCAFAIVHVGGTGTGWGRHIDLLSISFLSDIQILDKEQTQMRQIRKEEIPSIVVTSKLTKCRTISIIFFEKRVWFHERAIPDLFYMYISLRTNSTLYIRPLRR